MSPPWTALNFFSVAVRRSNRIISTEGIRIKGLKVLITRFFSVDGQGEASGILGPVSLGCAGGGACPWSGRGLCDRSAWVAPPRSATIGCRAGGTMPHLLASLRLRVEGAGPAGPGRRRGAALERQGHRRAGKYPLRSSLAKVLHQLVRAGLVSSSPGIDWGIPPAQIALPDQAAAEVVEAVDGLAQFSQCFTGMARGAARPRRAPCTAPGSRSRPRLLRYPRALTTGPGDRSVDEEGKVPGSRESRLGAGTGARSGRAQWSRAGGPAGSGRQGGNRRRARMRRTLARSS